MSDNTEVKVSSFHLKNIEPAGDKEINLKLMRFAPHWLALIVLEDAVQAAEGEEIPMACPELVPPCKLQQQSA